MGGPSHSIIRPTPLGRGESTDMREPDHGRAVLVRDLAMQEVRQVHDRQQCNIERMPQRETYFYSEDRQRQVLGSPGGPTEWPRGSNKARRSYVEVYRSG